MSTFAVFCISIFNSSLLQPKATSISRGSNLEEFHYSPRYQQVAVNLTCGIHHGHCHNSAESVLSFTPDITEEIILRKSPTNFQDAYVTGLMWYYKLPQELTVGTVNSHQTFPSN